MARPAFIRFTCPRRPRAKRSRQALPRAKSRRLLISDQAGEFQRIPNRKAEAGKASDTFARTSLGLLKACLLLFDAKSRQPVPASSVIGQIAPFPFLFCA